MSLIYIYPYPFAEKEELNGQYVDYLRFGFVCNPWDRLFSCFKDKIQPADFDNEEYIKGAARPLHHCSTLFDGGMSFDEFVDVVYSIPDAKAEHHFSSQLFQMTDSLGNLLVNYLGRFEQINEGLKEITQKKGIPFVNFPHLHKTKRKSYHEYYTDELIEKVRKRFSADIDFFSCEFDESNNADPIGFVNDKLKEKLSSPTIMAFILKHKNLELGVAIDGFKRNKNIHIE